MYIFRHISKSLSHRDKSNTNCCCLMKGSSGTVDSSQVHTLLTSLQVTQAGSHLLGIQETHHMPDSCGCTTAETDKNNNNNNNTKKKEKK